MITSTLSLSLFPKDKRQIEKFDRTRMTYEELKEFQDERNAFKAMSKEFNYETRKVNEKEKPYNDVFTKSKFFKAEYESNVLKKFRRNIAILNSNTKPIVHRTKA